MAHTHSTWHIFIFEETWVFCVCLWQALWFDTNVGRTAVAIVLIPVFECVGGAWTSFVFTAEVIIIRSQQAIMHVVMVPFQVQLMKKGATQNVPVKIDFIITLLKPINR